MKRRNWLVLGIAVLFCVFVAWYITQSKSEPSLESPDAVSEKGLYIHTKPAFAVRYKEGFTINEQYMYEGMGPEKKIQGVSFTVPTSMTEGTNLSTDTHMTVEWKEKTRCSVEDFLPNAENIQTVVDGDATYVVGMVNGAGAGNRYEEAVYVPEGVGCTAIRYFIHSTVLENYEPGTRKAFDRTALMSAFDGMRRSFSREGALD